jgi:hypothetical protein
MVLKKVKNQLSAPDCEVYKLLTGSQIFAISFKIIERLSLTFFE